MLLANKIKQILSLLLLVLLIFIMFNNAFFLHEHILSNGKFVVHAHPFSHQNEEDTGNKHTHTESEFAFIALINQIFVLVIIANFLFLFLQSSRKKIYLVFHEKKSYTQPEFSFNLRAPPSNL